MIPIQAELNLFVVIYAFRMGKQKSLNKNKMINAISRLGRVQVAQLPVIVDSRLTDLRYPLATG